MDRMFLSLVRWSNTEVDVSVAVNEWSWGSVQTVVPIGAALTRTSLSIQVYLRGRSAGLRRDPAHRRLTRPVTRGLIPAWLDGCEAAVALGGGGGGGEQLTCREGNYSKDKDYTLISPLSSLMKRAG